jgi:flagellar motor switch protein FliM
MAVVRDILSQEEITALLHGAGPGPAAPGATVELFDFAADDHRARALLPSLDPIAQGFAKRLQETLSEELRRGVDVSPIAAACHTSPAAALAMMGPASTGCIEIIHPPATLWVAIGLPWVMGMVDAYYGGAGQAASKGRDYTTSPAAAWVLRRLMAWIQTDLAAVWPVAHPLQLAPTQANHGPAVMPPGETGGQVIVQRFSLKLEEYAADLALVMPISLFAGLAAPVNSLDTMRQASWQRSMGRALREAPLTLTARLAEMRLTVGEVLALRVGDILPLEEPEQVMVYLEERPLSRGELGLARGRKVVRLGWRESPMDNTGMGEES